MRYCFSIFLLLVTGTCFSQDLNRHIDSIAVKYFKVIPQGKSVTEIIGALKANISLRVDTTIQQTDSSLFYLRGYSYNFNPFAIPAEKIEIQLREAVIKKPAPADNDTLFILQIIAPTDSSEEITKMLKSEAHRISNDLNRYFNKVIYKRSKRKDKIPFESYIYFSLPAPYHDLVFGWGGYYINSKIHCMSLTISCEITSVNNTNQ